MLTESEQVMQLISQLPEHPDVLDTGLSALSKYAPLAEH